MKSQNLWDACTEGNHALVELIFGRFQDANVNWVGPENGDTPLHRACRLGHLQVVEILLRHSQVNVNARNDKLATPLLVACQEGHVEVVKLLFAYPRVDVNLPQNGGYTPFFMACQSGYKAVVSLLLGDSRIDVEKPANGGQTPFFAACYQGLTEVVSMLLADQRIDANTPASEGVTPFSIACQLGHLEVVSLLLADLRVDVNKPDNAQRTPLWFASQGGHLPVVQLILASGREVDTKTMSISGPSDWNEKTAAEIARGQEVKPREDHELEEDFTRRQQNGPLIAALLDTFEDDPATTRQQLRIVFESRHSFCDLTCPEGRGASCL